MTSKDPSDPRSDSQAEAEEAAAAEEVRELSHPEGSRDSEADSAKAYAKAGIIGAPGSEVAPESKSRAKSEGKPGKSG
jgi:hypothetical protein